MSLVFLLGREADVAQDCPAHFYGYFWYVVTDSTGTQYCDDRSMWDGCTNNQHVYFNYTVCPTHIADSGKKLLISFVVSVW